MFQIKTLHVVSGTAALAVLFIAMPYVAAHFISRGWRQRKVDSADTNERHGKDFREPVEDTSPGLLRQFESAAAYARQVLPDMKVPFDQQLRLYGLYKHAKEGPCPENGRPGVSHPTARRKYDAWAAVGTQTTREEAMKTYVETVTELIPGFHDSRGDENNKATNVLARSTRRLVLHGKLLGVDVEEEDVEYVQTTPEAIAISKGVLQFETANDVRKETERHRPPPVEGITLPPQSSVNGRRASLERQELLHVFSQVRNVSYLSEQAKAICLDYVEIVDVPAGDHVFRRGEYDGSMLEVLSGKVQCCFHDFPLEREEKIPSRQSAYTNHKSCDSNEQADEENVASSLDYTVSPGNNVTPRLSNLAALVELRERMNSDEDDGRYSHSFPTLDIARAVSAVAVEPTRIVRFNPRCMSAVLSRCPDDVYNIAHTVVSRSRRVTTRVLIQLLGLYKNICRGLDTNHPSLYEVGPTFVERRTEWGRITSTLSGHDKLNGDAETSQSIQNDATAVVAALLGIQPDDMAKSFEALRKHSTIIEVSEGQSVIETGCQTDSFYLLLSGTIELCLEMGNVYHRYRIFKPGSLIGTLDCFVSDEGSLLTYRCCPDADSGTKGAILLKICKSAFDKIIRQPSVLIRFLHYVLEILSPVVHLVNWNMDAIHVRAAKILARKGDVCEEIFLVCTGRIRASYSDESASDDHFKDYGRGRCIGKLECLTGSPWPYDLFATRYSEIVRVPMSLLTAIIDLYPRAGWYFARTIASQIQQESQASMGSGNVTSFATSDSSPSSDDLNVATIAVLPLASDTDAGEFCQNLASAMNNIGPTNHVTKLKMWDFLGERTSRPNAMHILRMALFLGSLEEENRVVLYQADSKFTWWTKLCIQQADCILLLVDSDKTPSNRRIEECLGWAYESMHVRIELVVLQDHKENHIHGVRVSDELHDWSEAHSWVAGHHNMRVPLSLHMPDMLRMCRRITGVSIGLVLGGGGARGIAHFGVIRALMEAGITVDVVGGASQGAFVAAAYAKYPDDLDEVMRVGREEAVHMDGTEMFLDLTLPLTSICTGNLIKLGMEDMLGEGTRIQDLVLKFFCVTTDVGKKSMGIHTKGLLWKYARASMGLMGVLPPVTEEGSVLVDGGYLNNVPVDVMRRQMGARTVIAVDVGSGAEPDYDAYGTHINGWWLLWNRLNPFAKTARVPTILDLSDALTFMSTEQNMRNLERHSDLLLRPPVKDYGVLEYDKFEEICEKSYEYAKPIVDEWVKQNEWIKLDPMYANRTSTDKQ